MDCSAPLRSAPLCSALLRSAPLCSAPLRSAPLWITLLCFALFRIASLRIAFLRVALHCIAFALHFQLHCIVLLCISTPLCPPLLQKKTTLLNSSLLIKTQISLYSTFLISFTLHSTQLHTSLSSNLLHRSSKTSRATTCATPSHCCQTRA
jgi:hypothetical protein